MRDLMVPREFTEPVVVPVNSWRYASPVGEKEIRTHATAMAYEWGCLDTGTRFAEALSREGAPAELAAGLRPRRVPDGWPLAYLEHRRRADRNKATRMLTVQDAFEVWVVTGTLPGLD